MRWARVQETIQPFHVMEVLDRAKAMEKQGVDVARLEVGEPDFATPAPILEAARRALAKDQTRYTPALGLPELRAAVAAWHGRRYGVAVDPGRVIITPGTSGAFLLAFSLLLDPGARLAITDPGYPCYANLIRMVGGEPLRIPVGPESHYHFTPALLAPALEAGVAAALITSPSNPTGTLIGFDALRSVIDALHDVGAVAISDEIYHGISYGEPARSALEVTDRAIVINGFSKYFGMTGWRLGWMVVPEAAVRPLERLAQNLFISAPTVAQHAGLAALECAELLDAEARRYDQSRRLLLDRLPRLGFSIPVEPRGAFYVYADASAVLAHTGLPDASALCAALLAEAHVAITPGLDFGEHRADAHVRFSYAGRFERVREGVARIAQFLAGFPGGSMQDGQDGQDGQDDGGGGDQARRNDP